MGNTLHSEVLGLDLVQQDNWLRLRDVDTGELLPQIAELRSAAERGRQAEAENERLRAEIEALRRQSRNPS